MLQGTSQRNTSSWDFFLGLKEEDRHYTLAAENRVLAGSLVLALQ